MTPVVPVAVTTAPVLSGKAQVGSTLTTSTGAWSGTTPIAFSFAWQRCDTSGANCSAVAAADDQSYLLTSADQGKTLRAEITAANKAGSAKARTQPSAAVAAVPVATPPPPPPLATASGLPARMPESSGASYYVDGSRGSNSNPGSLALPWRTITYALESVPLSGSIVNVRAGTYVGMHQFQFENGNPSNPVTLQAYPGERVVLTSPSGSGLHALLVSKSSGIRIRGFEVTNPGANIGIKVENSTNVEIVGCEIHHNGRSGILVAGSGSSGQTTNRNVQIWNSRFHNNGGYSRTGDHSIYWGGTESNTDGVDHTTYGGVIANNLFYNQPHGFQLQIGSQASGAIVTNNTFYGANGPYPAGGAIALYTETATPAFVTRQVLIVNNLITNAANYGVYGSGGGGLMSTNVVRNNLAYNNARGDFLGYYGPVSNLLFQLGANFTGQDPLFVNPGGLDFRLQAGSAAVGKADPAYAPSIDTAGKSRSGAPDLGALESSG